jgi:hypothetical protein
MNNEKVMEFEDKMGGTSRRRVRTQLLQTRMVERRGET